jgi:hypothetical protein
LLVVQGATIKAASERAKGIVALWRRDYGIDEYTLDKVAE